MSQRETILKHLKTHGHITPAICLQVYGIGDYRKRISELRRHYRIERVTKRDLQGKKYSSWEYHGPYLSRLSAAA